MDRTWMYDLERINLVYIDNVHHFVEEAMRHANRQKRLIYFVPILIVKTKLCGRILKWSNHTWSKEISKKSYTIWTPHCEIDDALLEVNTWGVEDDNSHDQVDGVFDGDDHNIDDDDDDFDYEELLRHIESHVLNSMGIDRGPNTIKILEELSREHLYDESNGYSKSLLSCVLCYNF
jgi:hypothetical protein